MRDALMTCPSCGQKFRYSRMEAVSIYVQPSQKGGKKFSLRYCPTCILNVKARSSNLEKEQKAEWDRARGAQQQFMRDVRGK